jgi:ankyrin repeat protein
LLSAGLTPQRALMVELALERSATTGHAPVIRELLALGTVDDERKTALMHTAAEADQAATVEAFLDQGVPVNAEDVAGQTALHRAAAAGAAATVRLLLARGADPRASTRGGSTPLALAQAFRHPAVVALLTQAP